MAYGRTDSIFRYLGAAIGTTKSIPHSAGCPKTGYKQTPQIKTTGPSATPPTASKPAPRTAPSTPAATQEEAPGPPTTRARAPWDAATQAPQTRSRA